VVRVHDEEFVLADLPGLIEGASEGTGLGHRFLGHVERCAAILHLIDATLDDVVGAWRTIHAELEAYGHGLADKTELIALNKADAVPTAEMEKKRKALKRASRREPLVMSAATGREVDKVMAAVAAVVRTARQEAVRTAAETAEAG
ncbi:MAG: GTPase, partial [Stellaceae bacterium]